jgi:hypothetical protein
VNAPGRAACGGVLVGRAQRSRVGRDPGGRDRDGADSTRATALLDALLRDQLRPAWPGYAVRWRDDPDCRGRPRPRHPTKSVADVRRTGRGMGRDERRVGRLAAAARPPHQDRRRRALASAVPHLAKAYAGPLGGCLLDSDSGTELDAPRGPGRGGAPSHQHHDLRVRLFQRPAALRRPAAPRPRCAPRRCPAPGEARTQKRGRSPIPPGRAVGNGHLAGTHALRRYRRVDVAGRGPIQATSAARRQQR